MSDALNLALLRARRTAADPIACRADSVDMVDLEAKDLRLILAELDERGRLLDQYGAGPKSIEGRRLLAAYIEPRPDDEPHDKHCQVTLYGPKTCCTCESNGTRRRAGIEASAAAGETRVLDGMGSMEQAIWHRARQRFDPKHENPYSSRKP